MLEIPAGTKIVVLSGVALVMTIVIEARLHLIAMFVYTPWFIWICAVVIVVLCALFLLLGSKRNALARDTMRKRILDAEKLFVGCTGDQRQPEAILLDDASVLHIGQKEIFKTEVTKEN